MSNVLLYTDGACKGNPGPGGYAAILISGEHRKELSGGYRKTTNNRMELMGVIAGLQALKRRCTVQVWTDSSYVRNAMEQGWAVRWRANGWMRNKKERAENADLWGELLDLCQAHTVEFHWLRGHMGHPENERADQLAVAAAESLSLLIDVAYERG